VLARLGHDQFGLLLNDAEKRAAEIVLMRVIEAVEAHNVRQIHPWRLSFGIAFAHFDPTSPSPIEGLLADARTALADRKLRSFRLG
jgi:GGDEF domain-containing protein